MSKRRDTLTVAAISLATLGMLSCAGQKSISPDDIHSRIRSANSLLTETDMLIDFARELLSELQKSRPDPSAQVAADECRRQLERLVHELSSLPVGMGGDDDLAESKARLADIRQQLLHADSSL